MSEKKKITVNNDELNRHAAASSEPNPPLKYQRKTAIPIELPSSHFACNYWYKPGSAPRRQAPGKEYN